MHIRIRDVSLALTDCVTRLPFRFGMNTMTAAPTLTARARIDSEAGTHIGYSADLLVPKWFEKDPEKSIQQDTDALVASARAAADAFVGKQDASVFAHWWRVYRDRVHSQPESAADRLVRGFGVALVERAVIDATCRAAQLPFFDGLKQDLFGVQPASVYPELAGWKLHESLSGKPLAQTALRHTIGLVDTLRTADLEAGKGPEDGLPESLEQDIEAYGLRWFKLKLCGEAQVDLPRTLDFMQVLEECAGPDVHITVDGNEQFTNVDRLVDFFRELSGETLGQRFFERLICIEQPLPRAVSLLEENREGLAKLREFAPVILDEADHGIEAFPRALELGYGGVSVKNCKGVLRAMLHRGLCEGHRGGQLLGGQQTSVQAFQSAEDLTNLGVLALQQDLATVAALGLTHVERNGHHYFRGLDHLSAREAEDAARLHPDLWQSGGGSTQLRIEGGQLALASLQAIGYGYQCEIDWESRAPR